MVAAIKVLVSPVLADHMQLVSSICSLGLAHKAGAAKHLSMETVSHYQWFHGPQPPPLLLCNLQ